MITSMLISMYSVWGVRLRYLSTVFKSCSWCYMFAIYLLLTVKFIMATIKVCSLTLFNIKDHFPLLRPLFKGTWVVLKAVGI